MKKKIGKRVQMIRLENNVTQEQMADLLCISTSAYCKIEYGETDLTLTRIKRLAEIFNMSEVELASRLLSNGKDSVGECDKLSPGSRQLSPALEKVLPVIASQNRELLDKITKDITRLEEQMERIESRIQDLESFHLKD